VNIGKLLWREKDGIYIAQYYILKYNAVYSAESQPKFRRNIITSIFRVKKAEHYTSVKAGAKPSFN
jgi:hypothetical protein